MGTLQRKLALRLQSLGCVYPHGQALSIVLPPRKVLDILKVAKCPCKKVRRHDRCPVEAHNLVSIFALSCVLLLHIAQCHQIVRNLDLEVESRLEVWFVEARECSAGIRTLKLRREHVVVLVVPGYALRCLYSWLVSRSVEASHGVVHDTLETYRKQCLGRLFQLLVEGQCASLVLLVELNAGSLGR